jgi:hypothetical protein
MSLRDELEATIDLLEILVEHLDNNWPREAGPWPGRVTAMARIRRSKQILSRSRDHGCP